MSIPKPSKVRNVRKVSQTHKAPGIPKDTRRFAVLDVGSKSDRDKLEEKAADESAYPGTLPERLIYQWCIDEELTWYKQKRIYASHTQFMSAIVDVLILNYPGIAQPVIIRVQSQYWHSGSRGRRDDVQAIRLRSGGYRVVDLWEADIYRAALGGYLDRLIDDAIRSPFG